MGHMGRLHLLAGMVLDGATVQEVAERSMYNEEDIAWATSERLKKNI